MQVIDEDPEGFVHPMKIRFNLGIDTQTRSFTTSGIKQSASIKS